MRNTVPALSAEAAGEGLFGKSNVYSQPKKEQRPDRLKPV